jgi:hypothetical protein
MGVSPLQLVNVHRKRRYFVIKLHTWFFLSYFLVWSFMTKYLQFLCKFTSWSCGCIEKQIRCWTNCWYVDTHNILINAIKYRICFSIQPQLQLVNLHRNRRYFVIKLHTWFCLSYFLKTNIKSYCIYQYFKVLWRNISVFYVHLRVEVGKHP